ncbi:MAG: potassium transporter Kef, partial [Nitrosomonas sp.]|nr:potassium transporter Kef [Nitrosomonas sp.]
MFLAGTYLIAAFLGGYFARMLKLPPLLGFLVAGFVLKAMDVPGHPLVDSLANLGVTLMLFVVGLELDIRQLLRREVWLTTMAQTAVLVVLGIALFNGLMLLGLGLLRVGQLVGD